MRTISLLLLAALTEPFFPTPTSSQTHNVTFIVNTCTIPDTVGPNYNIQLRGNKPPLTWGNDTGGRMTNIGGDYWSKTLAFNVGDTIRYKIFAGTNGWESDVIPDPPTLPGDRNRGYIVANRDTILPLQFFNNRAGSPPQYSRPWTQVADSFMNVYVRVNMAGIIERGYYGFDNNRDTLGIRGGGPVGGDLNWSPTFYLIRESVASNGGFDYPANVFWSNRLRIPKNTVSEGQNIEYKFLIGYDWGRDELQGLPNRSFRIPIGKKDTTLRFSWFNNMRPSGRENRDTVVITFLASLRYALGQGRFRSTDTLLLQSGFFNTAQPPIRKKLMTRMSDTTMYQVADTVVSARNWHLDYSYYRVRYGDTLKESYYNYFYEGENPAEADFRQFRLPSSGHAFVADSGSSIVDSRRRPDFSNVNRILRRPVDVRWEVDLRPAWYQVAAGDTLFDIAGNRHITRRDSVMASGVWINGLATGRWQVWGNTLQQDSSRRMYDDGTNGDLIACDSVFTRMILATPDSFNVGTKGRVEQLFKFSIKGGDNEGGRNGFGRNQTAEIIDTGATFTIRADWGKQNPEFYRCWDYVLHRQRQCVTSVIRLPEVPSSFSLSQNYPNPFNPSTQIEYALPRESFVSLKVFNLLGQEVASLVNERQLAARHVVSFDGSKLSSGVYPYKLSADGFVSSRKMLLIR